MATGKQLRVLTGGNGAGKITFYRLCLQPRGMAFVNAAQIARDIAPDNPEQASYEAASHAALLRQALLEEGASFCYETVHDRLCCRGQGPWLQSYPGVCSP